jgi:hypothetical protein
LRHGNQPIAALDLETRAHRDVTVNRIVGIKLEAGGFDLGAPQHAFAYVHGAGILGHAEIGTEVGNA